MILVVDVETTGFPVNGLAKEDKGQARIVSIAAVLVTPAIAVAAQFSCYMQCTPYGITIPESATEVNGIDTATADKFGLRREVANRTFMELWHSAKAVAAFNVLFDTRMLDIEFGKFAIELPYLCLMNESNSSVTAKLTGNKVKMRYNLGFTYETLFGKPLTNAHTATSDMYAAVSILKYLAQTKPLLVAPYV